MKLNFLLLAVLAILLSRGESNFQEEGQGCLPFPCESCTRSEKLLQSQIGLKCAPGLVCVPWTHNFANDPSPHMGFCRSSDSEEDALAELKTSRNSDEDALALLSMLLNDRELKAEEEISGTWIYDTHILFENRLDVPVYVKGECNHKVITEETKSLNMKLHGEYSGFKGDLNLDRKVDRKFKNIIRDSGFTKIGPGASWKGYYPKVGKSEEGCQPVYVTYFVKKPDGKIELVQTSGQVENGKKMIIKGTSENPAVSTDAMCHGSYRDCGCYKGYCMSKCGMWQGVLNKNNKEWCYTSKGRKGDRKWVKCSEDKHCRPDWSCGGFCSIGW